MSAARPDRRAHDDPDDRGLLCVRSAGPHFVIIDKPAGLRSVPGRGEEKLDSVETRVRAVFNRPDGPVSTHRLDIETSGLIVVALDRPTHRSINRQFEQRKVGKRYVALLDGDVDGESGSVELPLRADWPNRPRQMVCHAEGRPSKTLWRVIGRERGRTRVELRPETGRTHQLRVHAATPADAGGLGAPIAGDTLYGDPTNAPRLLLHADMLGFWSPQTGEWVRHVSEAPF